MRQHIARKRFGQHFLVDRQVIAQIIESLALEANDRLVEIGPGRGALTAPLCARVDHLHVIEIDRDLIARLERNYSPDRLTIHAGDALLFDFARLAQTIGRGLRLVGNLPYNISTPLLFHLASFAHCLCDLHFMLQKEVVERMVAAPGSGSFGRLTVMLQYRFAVEHLFDVPAEAFDPPPQVRSAVVRLLPRPASGLTLRDEAQFARIVALAFGQRRKMLRNSLDGIVPADRLVASGISPTCRAEELAVDDYVRLANSLP
jgi:16S rRNA (adenine1518-N6/adenine1519-N6)-dimethyltransferase